MGQIKGKALQDENCIKRQAFLELFQGLFRGAAEEARNHWQGEEVTLAVSAYDSGLSYFVLRMSKCHIVGNLRTVPAFHHSAKVLDPWLAHFSNLCC